MQRGSATFSRSTRHALGEPALTQQLFLEVEVACWADSIAEGRLQQWETLGPGEET